MAKKDAGGPAQNPPFLRGPNGQIWEAANAPGADLAKLGMSILAKGLATGRISRSLEALDGGRNWEKSAHELYDAADWGQVKAALFLQRRWRQSAYGWDVERKWGLAVLFCGAGGEEVRCALCGKEVSKRALRLSKGAKEAGAALEALGPRYDGEAKALWESAAMRRQETPQLALALAGPGRKPRL